MAWNDVICINNVFFHQTYIVFATLNSLYYSLLKKQTIKITPLLQISITDSTDMSTEDNLLGNVIDENAMQLLIHAP